MKTIPLAVKNAINDGRVANCVKVITKSAGSYGYTDHDVMLQDLDDGNFEYNPSPGLQKIKLTMNNDAKVSNQEFGMAWLDAPESELLEGKFDNAQIEVRWFAYDEKTSKHLGSIVTFVGKLGIIQWSDEGFRADVHSNMRDLGRNIGNLVTPSCRHQLFSTNAATKIGACQVNEASHTYTGDVSAIVTDRLKFEVTGTIPSTPNWCTYGRIKFLNGQNGYLSFEVKKHTVGAFNVIELAVPTPNPIQPGDSFEITAGCDKKFSTCKNKFSNGANFGGFPHIQSEIMFR